MLKKLKMLIKKAINYVIDYKSIIFNIVFRGGAALSGVLMTLMVTRVFGSSNSGLFFLCLSIITFVSVISRCGLDNTILRLSSIFYQRENFGSIKSLLDKSFKLIMFAQLVFVTSTILLLPYLSTEVFEIEGFGLTLSKLVFISPILSLIIVQSVVFQSMNMTRYSILFQNFLLNSICIFLLFFLHDSFNSLLNIYIFATVTTFFVSFFFLKQRLGKDKRINVPSKTIFESCLPQWLVSLVGQIQLWAGPIFIGIWHNSELIAHFVASQRVTVVSLLILTAVNLMYSPKFANLYNNGEFGALEDIAKRCTRFSSLFALPIFIVTVTFSEKLMAGFGEQFGQAWKVLVILALGHLFNACTGPVNFLLAMTGFEKDLRNIAFLTMIVIISSSVFFIPQYGAVGAAIATTLSLIFNNLAALILVKRRLGFFTVAI